MAVSEALLFKMNGAKQAAQVAGLEGKTFTVGKISATGNTGLSKWLFLQPASSSTAGEGAVALKIEGTRQISQLSGLVGKTITIGKTPATVGGTGNWMLLNVAGKGSAAAATTGVAAAGAAKNEALSQMILLKAEAGRQTLDVSTLAGKSFTVVKTPAMAGTNPAEWVFLKPAGGAGSKMVAVNIQGGTGTASASSMVGKTYTISKAPMAAGINGHQWLAFEPTTTLAAKGAVATTTAAKVKGVGAGAEVVTKGGAAAAKAGGTGKAAMATAGGVGNATDVAAAATKAGATTGSVGNAANAAAAAKAGGTTVTHSATATTKLAKTTAAGTKITTAGAGSLKAAKASAAAGGGTIWKGTGLSLGLGLGLGGWGPLILVGAAAFGVGVYGYMRNNRNNENAEGELAGLTLEG